MTECDRNLYTNSEPIHHTMVVPDDAKEEMASITDTFNLLMGAKCNRLDVPITQEIGFDGTENEARGTAREIADEIEGEGYYVAFHHVEETENIHGEERHLFQFSVE